MRKILVPVLILLFVAPCVSAEEGESTNLVENEFFEEWEGERPKSWNGSHSFSTNWKQEEENVLSGNYSVKIDGGGERDLYQYGKYMEETKTYYAETWVKGCGKVKIGIKYPNSTYVYYSEPREVNTSNWTKVNVSKDPTNTGPNGGIRIKTNDSLPGTLYLGSTWLSDKAPPEDWAKDREDEGGGDDGNDDEEEDSDDGDDGEEDDGGDGNEEGSEDSEDEEERVEINSASQKELENITHIGEVIAERIVEDCDDFYSLAQLTQVKGLGESWVRDIMEEGKAYVLPPEDSEWDLSEDVCSDEDEKEGTDEDKNSEISITDLPDSVKLGETVLVGIEAYRNDTGKYALYGYVESKKDGRTSEKSTVYLKEKNTEYEMSIPVSLKPNCDGEYPNGSYEATVEGLGHEDSEEIEVSGIKEGTCPGVVQKEMEEGGETDERFELFDYDEEVETGGKIESTVILRNNDGETKEFTVYSYLYEGQECLNRGCWTGNEKVVEMRAEEKEILKLENHVKEDIETDKYDFNVRIRDEADLESEVEVIEKNETAAEEDKEGNKTEREGNVRKEVEDNKTETLTGKAYKRRGPLESIVYSIMELF